VGNELREDLILELKIWMKKKKGIKGGRGLRESTT
jgi:hypothetical protein